MDGLTSVQTLIEYLEDLKLMVGTGLGLLSVWEVILVGLLPSFAIGLEHLLNRKTQVFNIRLRNGLVLFPILLSLLVILAYSLTLKYYDIRESNTLIRCTIRYYKSFTKRERKKIEEITITPSLSKFLQR